MTSVEQVIHLIHDLSYDEKLKVSNYLLQVLNDQHLTDAIEQANHTTDAWKQTGITAPAETVFE